jgi:2-polyprenyl-6-methoxyphenol hydroxylase-like FAD-dependent oxidoreductase
VEVLVLEKHKDFLRDFRGDTLHPSTLELMDQIGLAEKVLQLPHSTVSSVSINTATDQVVLAEFGRLRSRFPYVALVPQWDFLNLLTAEAHRYPRFRLLMETEAEELITEDGSIRGVRYRARDGVHVVLARLTVAADGRWSRLRDAAGLIPKENSAPIDVFWFPISRRLDDPDNLSVRMGGGHLVVLINRFSYWQVGYLVLRGTQDQIRAAGLDAFKASLAVLVPELAGRLDEIRDWSQLRPLEVHSNRLPKWYRPGFLCIGDAAHAMSPIGGVGINVAIQDAVVAANVLLEPLTEDALTTGHLRSIQHQRELPVRITQAFQQLVQNRLQRPALEGKLDRLPPVLKLLSLPPLRWIPARLIGLGIRRPRISPRLQAHGM